MNVDGRLMVERLRQVPVYEEAFKELYGSDVSYGKVLNALSTFVASWNSTDHPYLDFLDGSQSTFSPEAKAGLELFQGKAGCARCHRRGTAFRRRNARPWGARKPGNLQRTLAARHLPPLLPLAGLGRLCLHSVRSRPVRPHIRRIRQGKGFERRHCSKPPVPPHTCTTESSPPWKMSCASTTRAVLSTTTSIRF